MPGEHVGGPVGLEVEAQSAGTRRRERWRSPRPRSVRRSRRRAGSAAPDRARPPLAGRSASGRGCASGDRPRGRGDPATSETRPGSDPALQVALPEPVLAVTEALPEPEVMGVRGADPRHPPAVAGDLDLPLEPGDPKLALGLRQRSSEELPPDAGCGGAEQGTRQPPWRWRHPSAGARDRSSSVLDTRRQPALVLELLEMGLHRDRRGPAELLGNVVPDLGEELRPRALAALERRQQPVARALGDARGTRRSSPPGRRSRGRGREGAARGRAPRGGAARPCSRPASRRSRAARRCSTPSRGSGRR